MAVLYRHPGYPRFSHMLRAAAREHGFFHVDRETESIYFLRDDGTAHSISTWTDGWKPSSGDPVGPDGLSYCSDAEEWQGLKGSREPLTLEVGHCWIEPVEFAAQTWDVVHNDQFGWGGPHPRDFAGSGYAWRAGDVLVYQDHSGQWLILVPENDPWTLKRAGCD